MAKINVYLPDDLAVRVKRASIPVSRICQAALAEALGATEESLLGDYESLSADARTDVPPNSHVGALLRSSFDSACRRGSDEVKTGDLLRGLLEESESLILNVLERTGFPREAIAASLQGLLSAEPERTSTEPRLSAQARAVLEAASDEARRTGSNVVTGANMLLALLGDPGQAGQALRSLGVHEVINPLVLDVLHAGVAYGRATTARQSQPDRPATTENLAERVRRLEILVETALEARRCPTVNSRQA